MGDPWGGTSLTVSVAWQLRFRPLLYDLGSERARLEVSPIGTWCHLDAPGATGPLSLCYMLHVAPEFVLSCYHLCLPSGSCRNVWVQSKPHRHQGLPGKPFFHYLCICHNLFDVAASSLQSSNMRQGQSRLLFSLPPHLPNELPLLLWSRNLPQIKLLAAWQHLIFDILARDFAI